MDADSFRKLSSENPPVILSCVCCGVNVIRVEDFQGRGGACTVLDPISWPPNIYCDNCPSLWRRLLGLFRKKERVGQDVVIWAQYKDSLMSDQIGFEKGDHEDSK